VETDASGYRKIRLAYFVQGLSFQLFRGKHGATRIKHGATRISMSLLGRFMCASEDTINYKASHVCDLGKPTVMSYKHLSNFQDSV
jgi:hypothetical protein